MHIPPYDNLNKAIVDIDNNCVPLNYFNIIKLKQGESFNYRLTDFETCLVPATGTINVDVSGSKFEQIGTRTIDVWDGEPEGVYVPTATAAAVQCISAAAEVFIAGARFNQTLEPFAVRSNQIDFIQYGSDDTKTHRKIKHILGQQYHDRVGRLLVSELYTVGQGGWSGFPHHKHDTDRLPEESRHDETYHFRFRPNDGGGVQILQPEEDTPGESFNIVNGSTVCIDKGYHPCVVFPGYEMYYFTILSGLSQRSLKQYFHPRYANQLKTIPGIMDMVAKFK